MLSYPSFLPIWDNKSDFSPVTPPLPPLFSLSSFTFSPGRKETFYSLGKIGCPRDSLFPDVGFRCITRHNLLNGFEFTNWQTAFLLFCSLVSPTSCPLSLSCLPLLQRIEHKEPFQEGNLLITLKSIPQKYCPTKYIISLNHPKR